MVYHLEMFQAGCKDYYYMGQKTSLQVLFSSRCLQSQDAIGACSSVCMVWFCAVFLEFLTLPNLPEYQSSITAQGGARLKAGVNSTAP